MNQWLLACLVIGLVGAWVPAVHTQGVFEDCCLAYNSHYRIKQTLIQRARSYQLQEASGSCNLPAVIFFLPRRQRKVCGDPQAKWVQDIMKHLDARNKFPLKIHGGTRKNSQGSDTVVRKGRPGTYRVKSPSLATLEKTASEVFPPFKQWI